MANKKALITGIAGQDGSYLAEYLLDEGYEVHGIIRRKSMSEEQDTRIRHLTNNGGYKSKIATYYGDVLDRCSLDELVKEIKPDEVYNLAAQSQVGISFRVPEYTTKVNALGVLNLLESVRQHAPKAKFYQASSSEMFGNSVDDDGFQRETTTMEPVSPYGCAKLYAYHIVRHYRKAYGIHACNGILFNHESPRRGANFVTQKIVQAAARIKNGLQDKLHLGDIDTQRDWGHAYDYVRIMHKIINYKEPTEFVIATGDTHTIREFLKVVFEKLDMNYEDYLVIDSQFIRPQELFYLRGDCTKAQTLLNWKPTFTFESLIDDMIAGVMNV